jgi:NAD(P)-dependent dehydrogenase (short-subunit alcohol dehydrogenase family)
MGNLDGKVALVTGAAGKRGIGYAIAIRLAREGADVVVSDIQRVPKPFLEEDFREEWRGIDSVATEIEALDRHALAIVADVSDSGEVKKLLDQALARFSKIDVLVNNAGISTKRGVHIVDIDKETWDMHLAVNLTGPFLLCKAIAKGMIERREGKIINISSWVGKVGVAGSGPYSASKFGLIGLTQTLALELAPHNINVNAVCPGGIGTDLGREAIERLALSKGITLDQANKEFYASFAQAIPLGRTAKAEEIANVVAFLASEESKWITGQSINVNGGSLMAH